MATPENTIVDDTVDALEENGTDLLEIAEISLTEIAIYMGWAAELC